MIGNLLKLAGGGKVMWIAIGVLVLSTVASAGLAKRYYDKHVLADLEIETLTTAHAQEKDKLETLIRMQADRYEAMSKAFHSQQSDYAKARREAELLRGKINAIGKLSPEVREYLASPVPDELYKQLFPNGKD